MKNVSYFILILLCLGCSKSNLKDNNEDARQIYQEHLDKIENYISILENDGVIEVDSKEIDKSCKFLENLTNIKAETVRTYDNVLVPSRNNFIAWREWFELYRELLYLDNNRVVILKFN